MNAKKIISYGVYFTAPKFMAFIKRYGGNLLFIRKAITLFYCMLDKETPKTVKAVIVGALGYLILPSDAVPDIIAGIGWIDDLAVLTFAYKMAERYIKPIHREKSLSLFPFGKEKEV